MPQELAGKAEPSSLLDDVEVKDPVKKPEQLPESTKDEMDTEPGPKTTADEQPSNDDKPNLAVVAPDDATHPQSTDVK